MSKFDDLITKYCPDGVEFKELWEVTTWDKKFNAVDKSKQKKVYKYPYLSAKYLFELERDTGDVFLLSTSERSGWTTEELAGDYLCEGEIVAIPWGGTPNVKYYKGKFVTSDNRIATSIDINLLSNKFLYYWMQSNIDTITNYYRGSGIKHPDMKSILNMKIPIPPLPVQQEIVRILDTFTDLTAELTAELTARKKQYEYYRDKLLTPIEINGKWFLNGKEVEWKKLGEVAELKRGRVISKVYLEDNVGEYPVYSSQTVNNGEIGKINTYDFDGEFITWTTDGANAGTVFYRKGKFSITNVCGLIKIINIKELNYKYLSYWLFIEAKKHVYSGMGNPKLMSNQAAKIPIPIPPLEEQERIVSILDKFDALTNSITEGLPREIELRQKQYEYYRDMLLNFPKKEN